MFCSFVYLNKTWLNKFEKLSTCYYTNLRTVIVQFRTKNIKFKHLYKKKKKYFFLEIH